VYAKSTDQALPPPLTVPLCVRLHRLASRNEQRSTSDSKPCFRSDLTHEGGFGEEASLARFIELDGAAGGERRLNAQKNDYDLP
jgi:hypothetical protein